jgi:hypothetical protein
MVALNRNSLGFGRAKVNTPKMTGVQFSVTLRTPVPSFHMAISACFPRPGSVRTTSANFVAYGQHSCALQPLHETNGA